MDLTPAINVVWSVTVGDLVVGGGTLALAVATGLLARHARREVDASNANLELTRESIEAVDRPFLVAGPENIDYVPRMDSDTGEVTGPELALSADLHNLGRGPAILDEVSIVDGGGRELVSGSWKVESAFMAGEWRSFSIGMGDTEFPDQGARLLLKLFYRSASGTRYQTAHHLEVGHEQRVIRLDFRRTTTAAFDDY